MASVSGRSVGLGSEVGELVDQTSDETPRASGTSASTNHLVGLPDVECLRQLRIEDTGP